jgi:hypothetical protein
MNNPSTEETMDKGENYSSSFTAKINAHEALEKIERLADWWTAVVEGNPQKVGDVFSTRFTSGTFVDFKLEELIPDKKAVWLVTDCNLAWLKDKKEWRGTRLLWELSPVNEGTQITMTHVGLTPRVECYGVCQPSWDFYIGKSLQRFMTEGKGLPDGYRRN